MKTTRKPAHLRSTMHSSSFPCGPPFFELQHLLAVVILASTASALDAQSITFDSMLDELVDRDRLAVHPNGNTKYVLKQASSYERASTAPGESGWFANSDWSWYIRSEQNQGRTEWVLMDVTGPGALTRFWTGGHPEQDGTLRFYVDGSNTPFWAGKASELVGQKTSVGSPLSSRTVEQDLLEGGARPGHNLYAPIPYAKGLKITFDVPPDHSGTETGFWYNINYRTYQPNTNVQSFDGDTPTNSAAKLASTNAQLLSPSTAPRGKKNQQFVKSGTIAKGQSISQALEGTGAVRRLQMVIQASDMPAALREVELEMLFDGQRTVRVPSGHFFGTGNDRLNEVDEWYRSVDPTTGEMIAYWVMPYEQTANIRIVNTGSQNATVVLEVETGSWAWTDDSMHFHATYREQMDLPTTAEVGQDWNYVNIVGSGVLVGDTLQVTKDIGGWWGEGDEKIFVDGESFPSHFGTGTEDYYGYAWGHRETFNQPFISQPQAGANFLDQGGTTVNNRTRALDAIPFDKSLKFDMEVWNWHGGPVHYSAAIFWYGRPGATTVDSHKAGDLDIK